MRHIDGFTAGPVQPEAVVRDDPVDVLFFENSFEDSVVFDHPSDQFWHRAEHRSHLARTLAIPQVQRSQIDI